MHVQDMAVVMAISAAVMVVFHRVRLPVVLGYILAGVIIGPHTPPFPLVRDLEGPWCYAGAAGLPPISTCPYVFPQQPVPEK